MDVVDDALDPATWVERQDAHAQARIMLARALKRLTKQQRKVFVMYKMRELNFTSIAKKLGKSTPYKQTFKKRYKKCYSPI